ncbi:MAG: nucleotidyltransferase family protein [Polyangiaceae bacterium]
MEPESPLTTLPGARGVIEPLRLLLARDADAPPAIERWDAAAWEAVHRAVSAWDAAALAASAARATGIAKHVPPAIFEAWRRDHTATTAMNMRLAFEADALVAALAARGIGACSLKGTALFRLGVYRDPGSRPTSDVDLIIAEDAGPAATRLLVDRGFSQASAGGPKHLPPFLRDGLLVELHEHAFWSLTDGRRARLADMRDPSGEPAIGPLVAHLLHHAFESSVTMPFLVAKTLVDLAEARAYAARKSAAIVDEIATCAHTYGLGRRLSALAGLLELVTGRRAPAGWTRDARPGDVEALVERAAPRSHALSMALRLPDRLRAFARMPRREVAAQLRYYLVPPVETMRMHYGLAPGSPWVWPLYPLRPLQLFARSTLDAARLLAARGRSGGGSGTSEVDPRRKKA